MAQRVLALLRVFVFCRGRALSDAVLRVHCTAGEIENGRSAGL